MEITQVTVPVPTQRLPEFYGYFSTWLATPATPAASATTGWKDGRPWAALTPEDAAKLYSGVSAKARAIIDYWLSLDGWATGDDTAEAVGVNGPKGVAGSLSSVGKACDRMGCELPFEHEPGADGNSGKYRIRVDFASRLRSIRAEASA